MSAGPTLSDARQLPCAAHPMQRDLPSGAPFLSWFTTQMAGQTAETALCLARLGAAVVSVGQEGAIRSMLYASVLEYHDFIEVYLQCESFLPI